jgi:signal transduction histidine kinase
MSQIPFTVSARAAQLIGRQNFSSAEGAILELVKNSYDADAKSCAVIFDIIYQKIPEFLTFSELKNLEEEFPSIVNYYFKDIDKYALSSEFSDSQDLKTYFFSKNSIYVIDNGEGMNEDIINNNWMTIGTGNKEYNYLSSDNRVKTGAKGIGRFALDRLGFFSEMWTYSKNGVGHHWQMDWTQFEIPNKNISDVLATLETQTTTINDNLISIFNQNQVLLRYIDSTDLKTGTVIKISGLKDIWDENALKGVFKSLEVLIPPRELDINFGVYLYHLQNIENYGLVDTAYFNDYDYKVLAKYECETQNVSLTFKRDELDLQKVKNEFSYLFESNSFPYDLTTIENKEFTIEKSVFELTKWKEDEKNKLLFLEVGDFSFTFYFLKIQASQKENYPYQEVNSAERKEILDRFGGVKIYRDSFRVRPYGDKGNDWLFLGERAAQSPAGPGQRVGDWRVRPNQIAGVINISRIENSNLIDKSDRGALIENSTFDTFKKIVVSIINDFEIDRTKILNPFFLDAAKKEDEKRKAEIQKEAEKLADLIIENREKEIKERSETFNFDQTERTQRDKEQYKKIFEKEFSKFQNDDSKDAEIAQVRNLASLGLIVASFAHELKGIRNNIGEVIKLDEIYQEIVEDNLKQTLQYKDGISILNLLKRDGEKTKHWVDYSLSAVKKDKRKRTELDFEIYFLNLVKQWQAPLHDRNIKIEVINNTTIEYLFRAFEMDMNTIFSNLISNSIDAFKNVKEVHLDRKITISYTLVDNIIQIIYSDNATGIPNIFSDTNDIFLPFITSKKDKSGNDIGTGLGMYLVKNVINDNNGTAELLKTDVGFSIQINFPTRANK